MLVFEERGKPEYQEKNLAEQTREPTTNSTHIYMASTPGFETRPLSGSYASDLTTAPSLALQNILLLLPRATFHVLPAIGHFRVGPSLYFIVRPFSAKPLI